MATGLPHRDLAVRQDSIRGGPQAQAAAEHLGWQLAGIVPGSNLEMVRPGEVCRVSEALYVKLLCPPEKLHPVDPGNAGNNKIECPSMTDTELPSRHGTMSRSFAISRLNL